MTIRLVSSIALLALCAATGAIAQTTSRAAPDGYTLLWASPGSLTVAQILEQDVLATK